MNKIDLITTRDFQAGDLNFVMATFLRGLYYGNELFLRMKKDTFMAKYHGVLEQLLVQPGVSVRVACLKEDPEVILGYAFLCQNETVAHWVFVKSAWRGIGIAKSLLPPTVKSVTHLTKVGSSILRKHPGIEFDPFLL